MSRPSLQGRITTVQNWLNTLLTPSPNLTPNGKLDAPTKEALKRFQRANGLPESGKLTTDTWKLFGKYLGTVLDVADFVQNLPQALVNLVQGQPLVVMRYDRSVFYPAYMAHFGGLEQSQIAGLDQLLRFIELDADITDNRWAAYMLTTVKTECADTWLPIAEYGCNDVTGCTTTKSGNKRLYGKPRACPADLVDDHHRSLTMAKTCPAGKKSHTYYGRGYVQLTHLGNYKKMGTEMGLGEMLIHNPEQVMEAKLAYRIMSYGMRHGSFTSKKLSDYIHGKKADYYNARRIINGINASNEAHAKVMAKQAEVFDHILADSLF